MKDMTQIYFLEATHKLHCKLYLLTILTSVVIDEHVLSLQLRWE